MDDEWRGDDTLEDGIPGIISASMVLFVVDRGRGVSTRGRW